MSTRQSLLHIILLWMFLNSLYATNNPDNFIKSITAEYVAGDIDGNIINMLKKLHTLDFLKLEQIKIKEDADICPLLKQKGLYIINCTKALSDFVTKINGGKKVFTKGDSIYLPIVEKNTEYTSQVTRASTFIPYGDKSISIKGLRNRLKYVNYRFKKSSSDVSMIQEFRTKALKKKFNIEDTLMISDVVKTTIKYQASVPVGMSILTSGVLLPPDTSTSSIIRYSESGRSPTSIEEPTKTNNAIYWNSFVSRRGSIQDYTRLKAGISYKMTIQISPWEYKDTSISIQGISDSFINFIDELCIDWNESKAWTEDINIISISSSPDIVFDEDSTSPSPKLDMGKLCSYRQDKDFNTTIHMTGKDLYAFIKKWKEQRFIFLNKSFKFSTSENAAGNYPIAFSIWHDNKPIDEIVMNLCVGDNNTCNNSDTYRHKKANITQISNEANVSRVASLHFFDFSKKNIAALFWDHNSSSIESWLIDKVYLNIGINTTSEDFNIEFPNYKVLSKRLFERIFGDNKEVANKFRSVLDIKNKKPFSYLDDKKIPEVYVRSIDTLIDNLDGIPIGLLPLDNDYNISKLLGLHYKIHRPLKRSKTPQTTCIKETGLMYPQNDGDDKAIKIAIRTRNKEFRNYAKHTSRVTIDSSSYLEKWTEEHKRNQKLFIFLGHFGAKSKLGFSATDEGIIEVGHFLKSDAPSIAILDACGTGVKDGGKFVSGLNAAGFSTIIATNAKISAYLGQEYLNCFVKELAKNIDRKIGKIHAKTLKCLYDIPKKCDDNDRCTDYSDEDNIRQRNFEMDVLKFTLYGAHNVKICK